MKVLLIGSGGRESALAYKIKESKLLTELKVYPGNAGFSEIELIPKNSFDLKNKESTKNFIQKEKFDLVIVGPEVPLVDGISDWLDEISIPCFGPSKYCAEIEGSKDFAKKLMKEFSVPTAKYESFISLEESLKYIESHPLPIVVKADGLASGKGVSVCESKENAIKFLEEIFLDKRFSENPKVVIEEFLAGEEVSIFAISDGNKFVLLPPLQDHKRAYDGDLGPNTGGMGAYSPAPIATKKVIDQVKAEVFEKMISGLKKNGTPYKGLLYAGLMVENEIVKVVEFNSRFGDPETQSLMLLIEDDLLEIMYEAAKGNLKKENINISNLHSSVVVLCAVGYPNEFKKDILISLKEKDGIKIFHAGTKFKENQIYSDGGRILGIASTGNTLLESLEKSYKFLNENPIEHTFYRKDIGKKAL
jgi:phosphoribosylamine---glycine ligase